ncbi:hypothetical protein K1W54_32730, partial [Micromonospora sp. CPCC 205371]|nr:hypothetical protein [Micromonospora sp. CPCC 205371]
MTTTLDRSAAPPDLSRRQTNVVFITIVLGMLLAALDQTIVSTALPDDRRRSRRRAACGGPRAAGGRRAACGVRGARGGRR